MGTKVNFDMDGGGFEAFNVRVRLTNTILQSGSLHQGQVINTCSLFELN